MLRHFQSSLRRGFHGASKPLPQRRSVATINSWAFPCPCPPPSAEEVATQGLPLLRQVVEHADRPFLNEPPDVEMAKDVDYLIQRPTLSYHQVLSKAALVSLYIQQTISSSSNPSQSPFIAHSTNPGSAYIACQWGTFAAGKASVPLALSQKTPELEHVLQDANPLVIFCSSAVPNHQDVLQAAHNLNMSDRVVMIEEVLQAEDSTSDLSNPRFLLETAAPQSSLDNPALLMYTSGTTGKPKGVLHTHRSLYHQITDLVAAWEWQKEDVALHTLPLHHVHGVVNILSCASYVGAQLQFQPFEPETLWRLWAQPPPDRNRAGPDPGPFRLPRQTVLMAVPTIYARLLETAKTLSPELVRQAVVNTLYPMRLQISGSAALPTSILNRWRELTGHTLLERYGMTEFAMALSNPYNEIAAPRQPGYVGLPLPSVSVRLVDEATDEVVDTPETAGELQVKGPNVFREYWNRPDATTEAFTEDGYFRTGDVAEYSEELESYRILGRASVDILKVGGHKLSALEIERTLLEHPDVLEVAILGVEDPVWGQRVAMIGRSEGNGEPTLEEIQDWCESRLAKYKTPTRLYWVDAIPKNAMGKVNKKELVQLFNE
eukprot:Nitzschia sp. Nitz4//scaffold159_size51929//42962//44770//NITZ4_ACSL//1//CDS//3329537607//8374//frame0